MQITFDPLNPTEAIWVARILGAPALTPAPAPSPSAPANVIGNAPAGSTWVPSGVVGGVGTLVDKTGNPVPGSWQVINGQMYFVIGADPAGGGGGPPPVK